MVGGGPGAFIGEVHRMAARLDGRFRLVAGAFSADPEKSARQGRELGLDAGRTYGTWDAMASAEAARDDGIEAVVIVTPNHLHHPVARRFLEAGLHVICDKPLTRTVEEAEELCRLADSTDRVFCVTYNYTGYPMVKEARARARNGSLGTLRKVVVEYSQGWLSSLIEADGQKQAEWRTDPARAGVSSALGDIGTHAMNLVEYVTGLRITRLMADLGSVVPGREMDDDAHVLLRLGGGTRGVLICSQVSFGERNGLRLRVYGSDGALDWRQEAPNDLRILEADGTERILHTGGDGFAPSTDAATRLPAGHPEGFIEAFANVYRATADAIRGTGAGEGSLDFPTVRDGARGVHFVHAAVRSHRNGGWVDATYTPPGG
jgi:predicted dehydrogenase